MDKAIILDNTKKAQEETIAIFQRYTLHHIPYILYVICYTNFSILTVKEAKKKEAPLGNITDEMEEPAEEEEIILVPRQPSPPHPAAKFILPKKPLILIEF